MIKLTAKRVYCPNCQKLVRVKQQNGEQIEFSCVKCNRLIWEKNGFKWKHNRPEL